MVMRLALFILMALGLAGFGAIAWIGLRSPTPTEAEAAPSTKVSILVAARPLRTGNLVKPEDLSAHEIQQKDAAPGARVDSPRARTELLGAMIRRNLTAGEALLSGDLLSPGDRGFLAAVLTAGMRAVTVGVDAVSGIAGLIWPGDRVDLILTQSQDDTSLPPGRRISGETVLRNVRVIAIDRQLLHGATSESPETQAVKTVTLEVTPIGAERVTVAQRLGHLSLTVLAADTAAVAADDGQPVGKPQDDSITWGGDVSAALRRGSGGGGATVRVFQGPTEGKEVRF